MLGVSTDTSVAAEIARLQSTVQSRIDNLSRRIGRHAGCEADVAERDGLAWVLGMVTQIVEAGRPPSGAGFDPPIHAAPVTALCPNRDIDLA